MELKTLGQRLRKLREDRGLLQKDVGTKLGVSDRTVGNYEADDRSPDPDMLKKLADYYGVSIDILLYGFEKTRILNLIDAARYDRTLEQLAADANIDFEYLKSICDGSAAEPPSPETIKKIMDSPKSRILSDYYELMEAAGHIDHQIATELKLEEMKKVAIENRLSSEPRFDSRIKGLSEEGKQELDNFIGYLIAKHKKKEG